MLSFEIDENGFVMFPGSEDWRSAYDDGARLDQKFPGQDAQDFTAAMCYNDEGPIKAGVKIVDFKMLQEGYNDGRSWIWKVTLHDDSVWFMTAWADYTGWDCQSGNEWSQTDPMPERHCETCSCER